ncbi:MAG: class I SAM-dependent methyltransferase [Saprospiraceae bacterium]
MLKQSLSSLLRKLHLAQVADLIRYKLMYLKNYSQNIEFKKQNPNVILPPDYLMYESFQINYSKYYTGGREDAREIIDLARPLVNFNASRILDWGCGPARLIRHFPSILGKQNEYFGTDYNAITIEWCTKNISGISISKNEVNPPLNFPDNHFTFIYGISILTHLSPDNQHAWSRELHRIVKPDGIVLLTTHGEAFVEKLTKQETDFYNKGQLVARGNVSEGHRMYGTFHPPAYMKTVFEDSGFTIEKFIPGKRVNESFISQDTWLLRAKKSSLFPKTHQKW